MGQSAAREVHDEVLLGFGFVFRLVQVLLNVLRRVLEVSQVGVLTG